MRAIWNSDSKSLITRSPRTIAIAPVAAAKSTVRPSKVVTSMRGRELERGPDHLHALGGGEQRRLPRVLQHPDDHAVEDRGCAIQDVEVPERHRIEAAGVYRDALAHAVPSDGAAFRCRKLMVVRP